MRHSVAVGGFLTPAFLIWFSDYVSHYTKHMPCNIQLGLYRYPTNATSSISTLDLPVSSTIRAERWHEAILHIIVEEMEFARDQECWSNESLFYRICATLFNTFKQIRNPERLESNTCMMIWTVYTHNMPVY